jgi:CDP-diglyceride synthetase
MHLALIAQWLVLLSLANGTPVIAKKILGEFLATPVDLGANFVDGRRLFGPSKTWRGIALSVAATGAGAFVMGLPVSLGLTVGLLAMGGDLFSSCLKRRMNLAPSSQAIGLDQVPESLFPLLATRNALETGALDMLAVVLGFIVCELVLSRLLFKLKIRDRPY